MVDMTLGRYASCSEMEIGGCATSAGWLVSLTTSLHFNKPLRSIYYDHSLLILSEAADKEQVFIRLSNSSIACAVSQSLDTELFKKQDCS